MSVEPISAGFMRLTPPPEAQVLLSATADYWGMRLADLGSFHGILHQVVFPGVSFSIGGTLSGSSLGTGYAIRAGEWQAPLLFDEGSIEVVGSATLPANHVGTQAQVKAKFTATATLKPTSQNGHPGWDIRSDLHGQGTAVVHLRESSVGFEPVEVVYLFF